MIRQAIDARFAFGRNISQGFGGREIHGPARGRKKCMAKVIVVEEAVHVGAQHAA
jgi:hypothetical protein